MRPNHSAHPGEGRGPGQIGSDLAAGIPGGAAGGHCCSTISDLSWAAASAGVVMAAALPVILGAQLLMQALNFDVLNVPSRPIHPYLRTIARMEAEEHARDD